MTKALKALSYNLILTVFLVIGVSSCGVSSKPFNVPQKITPCINLAATSQAKRQAPALDACCSVCMQVVNDTAWKADTVWSHQRNYRWTSIPAGILLGVLLSILALMVIDRRLRWCPEWLALLIIASLVAGTSFLMEDLILEGAEETIKNADSQMRLLERDKLISGRGVDKDMVTCAGIIKTYHVSGTCRDQIEEYSGVLTSFESFPKGGAAQQVKTERKARADDVASFLNAGTPDASMVPETLSEVYANNRGLEAGEERALWVIRYRFAPPLLIGIMIVLITFVSIRIKEWIRYGELRKASVA